MRWIRVYRGYEKSSKEPVLNLEWKDNKGNNEIGNDRVDVIDKEDIWKDGFGLDLLFSPNNESGELYELTVNLEREREKCKECINIVKINLNKLVTITNEFASPFKDISSDFLLEKQSLRGNDM